jgi:hypothetical protein
MQSKLLEEEFSLDTVCSERSDTSSIHQEMRDSSETKSITISMISERGGMIKKR